MADTLLDPCLPPAAFNASIITLLQQLLPGWGAAPAASLALRRISGGITNALMRAERPGAAAVLVRVFGSGSDLLIDRAADGARSAWLGRVGAGPAVLATFRNGRVEAWIDRARPLEPQEMGARAPFDAPTLIAREVARFHALVEPAATATATAGPVLWEKLGAWARLAFAGDAAGAAAWEGELAALAERLPSHRNGNGAALLRALAEGGGEAPPLRRARAEGAALAFRVAFCHNDLLAGNVLLLAEEAPPRVALIDFEYGAPNFAGFDVGNHWCEHVGFLPYDLGRLPDAAGQEHFLRAYVAALGARPPTAASYEGGGAAEGGEDAVSAAFWDELRRQCELFMLASHLWWGLWARVQAAHSAHADFDYALYARERLAAYGAHKARLLVG